jgi:DNA invertase Pin-like site-specific DNA recombinase
MANRHSTRADAIPVAAYLRMSSDQQDTSIADQKAELLPWAEKRGYRIVRWYVDEGVSGWKSKQRLAFQELIADAPEGIWRGVVCWDQSRFSRFDPLEANHYWFILRRENVFIETIKEGRLDFDTLGGWLSASVQQHAKAEYCKSLSADVVRGRRRAVLEGNWITAAPIGYRLDRATKRLVFGPDSEVELVRRVFRMRASGLGCRLISQALNKEGSTAPRGGKWHFDIIARMLRRETYIGHMLSGRTRTGKFHRMFDEPKLIENTHPPIIDRELWNKVRAIEGGKKIKLGRRAFATMPLSGLLHCGCCGRPMYVDRHRQIYKCGTYHSASGCTHNILHFDAALAVVVNKIRDVVLYGSLDALTDAVERALAKRAKPDRSPEQDSITRQIAEIDRKLGTAAERLLAVDDSLVATVQAAMGKLKAQRDALEAQLAKERKPARKTQTAKDIAAGIWRLNEELRKGDGATVRQALCQIIDRIDIHFRPCPMPHSKSGRVHWKACGGQIHFVSNREPCATSELAAS